MARTKGVRDQVRAAFPDADYKAGIGWCGPSLIQAGLLEQDLRGTSTGILSITKTDLREGIYKVVGLVGAG